jgi:phosphatidate cytidylyltransferase
MAQARAEAPVLIKRIISALVMIPPVLGAIFYGYPAFDILIVFIFVVLTYEWSNLCNSNFRQFDTLIFFSGGGAVLISVAFFNSIWAMHIFVSTCVLLLLIYFCSRKKQSSSDAPLSQEQFKLPWLVIGFCYIGIALITLLLLRSENDAGRNIILLLFLIAWAADTGAYAFGRLIGGPRLAPVLSPNKTWAGFIGGVFCAGLVGAGFALFIKDSGLMILTISAIVLGIISQCGDLLESRIKRLFQVKDAGSLIPGHGGLLDRVDSLLAMSWAIGLIYWMARDEVLKWM